ncbi:hypothetical protein QL285_044863 [Trifolium repens]|nr:hypothetical protein QL285_044863 [Trifolium repens]
MPQETAEELKIGQELWKKGVNQLKTRRNPHASPIEERRQPFVVPAMGLPGASDATIMGDSPTSTTFSAAAMTLPAELVCPK